MPVRKPVWLWVGTLALGAALVLAGVVVGRATAPQPMTASSGDGASAATPTGTARPSEPAAAGPSTPTVAVTGGPGQDVLAAAGSGDDVLLFTASSRDWTVTTTSRCGGVDDFVLAVRRGDQVVARLAGTGGVGTVVVQEPGDHVLEVGGTCSWTVEAVS